MILLPLALAALVQTGAPAVTKPALPADPREARYQRCVTLAERDPGTAHAEAARWQLAGGGFFAQQCLGLAYATERNWVAAASAFEQAAGNAVKARAALDAALGAGELTGFARGEVQLDRARALVADGQMAAARVVLDAALTNVPGDPLAWLLSATLARRMNDLPRAQEDIAQALARSADDANVQLEAGNIAAASGDEAGARKAWSEAARLAPADSPIRSLTAKALAQFQSR